ncbi:metallophosphoesterase [Desulfovibrio sp. OttesenSCG-928-O18]|nr:metallophosphoesterase [Desulfovibrio sp. OttesenSCG-928-O18]
MILLHIYALIMFFYITFRFIVTLPLPWSVRVLLVCVTLVFSQYHFFTRYFFGSLASPEMPYPLLVIASFGFILVAVLFALLLVRDLFLIVLFLVRQTGFLAPAPFSAERRAFAVAGLGLVLAARGYQQAVTAPDERAVEIRLDRLPPELDGLVIAHVTDLHATALLNASRVEAVVKTVNAMDADIVLCTGDLVDGSPVNRAADIAPLKDLRARYGVYACDGNHEYYSGYGPWMRRFEELGLTMLRNENAVLSIKGKQLVVAGITDPVALSFGLPGPDVRQALADTPRNAPVVLLAHQPRFARHNAEFPVDLQLSGHTHGGQLWGFDRIVASRNDGFLRGLYTLGRMQLYVNSGAGLWTGFPVRLGVPSEIARIVLRAGKG